MPAADCYASHLQLDHAMHLLLESQVHSHYAAVSCSSLPAMQQRHAAMMLGQHHGLVTVCRPGDRTLQVPAVDMRCAFGVVERWQVLLRLDDEQFIQQMSTSPEHEAASYVPGAFQHARQQLLMAAKCPLMAATACSACSVAVCCKMIDAELLKVIVHRNAGGPEVDAGASRHHGTSSVLQVEAGGMGACE